MSWKSISKISRNPPKPAESPTLSPEQDSGTPVSLPKDDRKAEAKFLLQSIGALPIEESKTPLQKRLDAMSEEDQREDMKREGLMQTLKQQYLEGRPFDQILAESGIPRATLFRWRKEQKWDEEKNKKLALAQKLAESLAFYENPINTEQALAQSNLQLLLRIQGMNLAKLAHRAISGESPDIIALSMADSLSKYSSMLEKLIKSDQSIKSGGVERKEVVHVHQLDMDDALKLALDLKKQGQQITVQDAMALLQAQQSVKKTKADEHHD